MKTHYTDLKTGKQLPRWFVFNIYSKYICLKLGKYEVTIYRWWPYKFRMEVY